jgi:hypothetical protein
MIICKGVLLIGQTPDFHFEPTIMILHIIDKPLIQGIQDIYNTCVLSKHIGNM